MKKKNINILKKRFRFTVFIVIMIVITVASANTILGLNDVSGKTENEYITIEVGSGDSLWTIAETYMPEDMDTREAIYLIKEINNMDESSVTPGQELLIPTNNFSD